MVTANSRLAHSDRGDLSELLHSLTLNPISSPMITIAESDFANETEECQESIVGRFCSNQEINFHHFQLALCKAWKNAVFKATKLQSNTHQFFFSNRPEKAWVLENDPWTCNDTLLALQPWTR